MLIQGNTQLQQNKGSINATLYRVVFESAMVKSGVLLLLLFLFIQPCAQAYAAFDDAPNTEQAPAIEIPVAAIPVADTVSTSDVDTDVQSQQLQSESVQSTTPIDSSEISVTQLQIDSATSTLPEETQATNGGETSFATSSNNVTSPNVSSTTNETTVHEGTESVATTSGSTIVVQSDTVATSSVATSTEVIEPVIPSTPLETGDFHNAAAFQFDTTQCAVVGNGAYYCNEKKATSTLLSDGVFAAPDSDGDLEIFVRLQGKETQITHNTYDDAAPHYDARSNRIVWHAYINDRYQIISYDVATAKMLRITDASYNNMEPVAYGTTTVWQAWINNNWEIMLYDGVTLHQITNNALEDVSPHIRDGYVIWQTQFVDGWQVAVYNLETKQIEYIPSEGGLKVENPRFVLVYDSTDKNGDIKTKGYDFDSKTSFDLGSLPAELPTEVPDPDQTGETRALLQNKQTSRESEIETAVVPTTGTTATSSQASSSVQHTLDLSLATSSVVSGATTTQALPITDVVVPSFNATSTTSQDLSLIQDIVIPPVVSTSTQDVR